MKSVKFCSAFLVVLVLHALYKSLMAAPRGGWSGAPCQSADMGKFFHHLETLDPNTPRLAVFRRAISLVCLLEEAVLLSLQLDPSALTPIVLRFLTVDAARREVLNRRLGSYGGETLLTYTITENVDVDLVHTLLEAGADPFQSNEKHETPFYLAIVKKRPLVYDLIFKAVLETLRNSSRYGEAFGKILAYLSQVTDAGDTALCAAIRTGQRALVHVLLDLGVFRPHPHPEPHVSPLKKPLRHSGCSPLEEASRTADARLVQRILQSFDKSTTVLPEQQRALSVAVRLQREPLIQLLLRHVANLIAEALNAGSTSRRASRLFEYLEHLPASLLADWTGYVMPEQSERLQRIFWAMDNGLPSTYVLALVEVEISVRNARLCSAVNALGSTLLHRAVICGYELVAAALVEFYDAMLKGQFLGYEACYADAPDKLGRCVSASLLSNPLKHWSPQLRRNVLEFLLSRRDPVSGENCLHRALRDRAHTLAVFEVVGEAAARQFGPAVLDLAGQDRSGKDLLFHAITLQADEGVLAFILRWLSEGAEADPRYELSLLRNIFIAAGGHSYGDRRFLAGDAHVVAVQVAAAICPVALQHLLSTKLIITPSDELAYRELLRALPGPFKTRADNKSPLSQAVRGLLWPLNMIDNPSLVIELAGAQNVFSATSDQLSFALTEAGSAVALPFLCQAPGALRAVAAEAVHARNAVLGPTFSQSGLPGWGTRMERVLPPLLGDERIIPLSNACTSSTGDTPGVARLNPHASFFPSKRAKIIGALLSSPLAAVHPRIRFITITLWLLSATLLLIKTALIGYAFRKGSQASHGTLVALADIALTATPTWWASFLEGFRRALLIPRFPEATDVFYPTVFACEAHLFKKENLNLDPTTHLSRSAVRCATAVCFWKRFCHLCLLWYLVEAFVISTYYVLRHKRDGVSLYYYGPLRFVFPVTIVLHATLARLITPLQAAWIHIFLFGVPSTQGHSRNNTRTLRLGRNRNCGFSVPPWKRCLIRHFYWIPGSYRVLLTRLRDAKAHTNTGTMQTRRPRKGCTATPTPHLIQDLKRRWSRRSTRSWRWSHRLVRGRRSTKCAYRCILPANPAVMPSLEGGFRRSGVIRLSEKSVLGEGRLLSAALHPIGRPRGTGFGRDLVLLQSFCFIVAQLPLWRAIPGFQLLYFEIFNSYAKHIAYMGGGLGSGWQGHLHGVLTVARELAILVALWQQLVQLGLVVLLALRLAAVFARVSEAIERTFSLRHIPRKLQGLKPKALKAHVWWDSCMIEAYLDVRQSVFKQFEFIWNPVRQVLSCLVLFWALSFIVMYPFLSRGALVQLFFCPKYHRWGTQLTLYLLLMLWFVIRATYANASAAKSWKALEKLYILPPPHDNLERLPRQLILQAVRFFKPQEFRLNIAGATFSVPFSFALFIVAATLAFDLTMRCKVKT